MLDELHHEGANEPRLLHDYERRLLESLLAQHPDIVRFRQELPTYFVRDMQDGGMGSIRFLSHSEKERQFGTAIVEALYFDEDGVAVNIAVNIDNHGDLYEVDFWKADFSSLNRYPTPNELQITQKFIP